MTPRGSLVSVLGVSFGLAVTVGNTIAAGILRTPGDVAASFPDPVFFIGIWVVGALYALLGANAISELGTMLPRAGAQYVFARHAFGDYAGFVVGWNDWVSTTAAAAAISIVFGDAAAGLIAGQTGGAGARLSVMVAAAAVVAFGLVLSRGTRQGARVQELTSLLKVLVLLALVVACFAFAGRGGAATPPAGAGAPASFLLALVLAAQAVIYTYDGWTGPIYFSEELHDPGRQIPRAMFGGLLCVATIYILVNVAFMTAVPPTLIAGSTLAAATVARELFGATGDVVVRAVVVVALPSAIIANLLMASRVLFALGRDGLGPRPAAYVNAGGTPTTALFLTSLLALGFVATGTFQSVIAVAAFFFVANYTLSFIAVFTLRRREPEAPRPYRARGHPWSTGLVLTGSLAFLAGAVAQDTRNSVAALALLVVSYPVFRVVQRARRGVVGVAGG
ncbi:MAG: APC family permease [Gemmatimonadota bacterium]|nr:APC family permease [Gemmatimonadota bacterium]